MRYALEARNRLANCIWCNSSHECGTDRSEHVADAVVSRHLDLADGHDAPAWPCCGGTAAVACRALDTCGDDPSVYDADPARKRRVTAIGNRCYAPLACIRSGDWIVEVDNECPRLVDQPCKPLLDAPIRLHRTVAIKVVGSDIRIDTNINRAVHRWQLKL